MKKITFTIMFLCVLFCFQSICYSQCGGFCQDDKVIKEHCKIQKKVLIVVTSHNLLGKTGKPTGYYLPEVTHPYFKLIDSGFNVDIASIKGGKAPMDESSRDLKDPLNFRFLVDPEHDRKLQQTLKLSSMKASDYNALIFAGGHGTMWDFPDNKDVLRLAAEIYENGGIIAAVCHGPAALVNIKLSNGNYLVAGKKVTAFSNDEEDAAKLSKVMPFMLETELIKRGAVFEKAPLWKSRVVADDRLVTGQNPASASELGKVIADLLKK